MIYYSQSGVCLLFIIIQTMLREHVTTFPSHFFASVVYQCRQRESGAQCSVMLFAAGNYLQWQLIKAKLNPFTLKINLLNCIVCFFPRCRFFSSKLHLVNCKLSPRCTAKSQHKYQTNAVEYYRLLKRFQQQQLSADLLFLPSTTLRNLSIALHNSFDLDLCITVCKFAYYGLHPDEHLDIMTVDLLYIPHTNTHAMALFHFFLSCILWYHSLNYFLPVGHIS